MTGPSEKWTGCVLVTRPSGKVDGPSGKTGQAVGKSRRAGQKKSLRKKSNDKTCVVTTNLTTWEHQCFPRASSGSNCISDDWLQAAPKLPDLGFFPVHSRRVSRPLHFAARKRPSTHLHQLPVKHSLASLQVPLKISRERSIAGEPDTACESGVLLAPLRAAQLALWLKRQQEALKGDHKPTLA